MFDYLSMLNGDPLHDYLVIKMFSPLAGFIADGIATPVELPTKEGTLEVMGWADKLKNTAPRQDREPAKETLKVTFENVKYRCDSLDERVFISKSDLDNKTEVQRQNYRDATGMLLSNLILLKKEAKIATLAQTESIYGDNVDSPSSKFDENDDTFYPIKYLQTIGNSLRKKGIFIDSMAIGYDAALSLISHVNVEGKLSKNEDQIVTAEMLLPLLRKGAFKGLQNLYIGGGVYDSNNDSDTRVPADFWADNIILFKKAKELKPGIVEHGAFVGGWVNNPDDFGGLEYKDEVNKLKGTFYEQRFAFGPFLLDPETAYFIKECNTQV